MKATELRIGNKLLNDGVVVAIDGRSIFDIWNDSGLKNYQPIPLTEEWLLKFGFEGTKDSGGTYYAFQRHRVYLLNDGFEFEISTSEFSRANLFRTYKCVHQLQNLYFAITGEELTINESTN